MGLSIQNIYKRFGDHQALKGVSLTINTGEIVSLSGESGCGKSTLLRIIAGLETADQGSVFLNDNEITNWKPEQRRFGFVFQNLSLFPHLSIQENVFFGLKKSNRSASKLLELLEMTGLQGMEKRFPHQLSGGQQQRVALARALAINPEILILDEPFSSLDELLKAKIREDIFNLLKSLGITTILVSHQPNDAFLIADKLFVMKDGELLQEGTPMEIYQHPSTPYVSDFFGASVIINGVSTENEVSTSFGKLKMENLHSGATQLFIRPENILITNKEASNLSGRILKKEFKGPHDVLKIESRQGGEFISLETERCEAQEGDMIFLKVPEEKIQLFS